MDTSFSHTVAVILTGCIVGMFAGLIGMLARRLAARRLPLAIAVVIGIAFGGTTGFLSSGMVGAESDHRALAFSATTVAALIPWVTTWRFFEEDHDTKAVPNTLDSAS